MSFKQINSLWDCALLGKGYRNIPEEKFRSLKQLIEASDVLKMGHLINLFKKKIERYCDATELTIEAFECFRSAFVVINEYLGNISDVVILKKSEKDFPSRFERLKIKGKSGLEEDGDFQFQVDIMPTKLEGYTTLWKVAQRAENEEVARKARNLLVYLHMSLNIDLHSQIKEIRKEYLEICFENLKKLRSEESSKYQILRCFDLIHALIDMSHMADKQDNLKRPKLFCEFDKGKLLTIKVRYEIKFEQETIQVYSNMLVCDLFAKCTKQFKLTSNAEIYLEERTLGRVINILHKTRTISSLGIKDQANLVLKIRLPPEAYLIQHDNTLNPKAREIFTEWFDNYSDNGKMNAEQCVAFEQFSTKFKRKPNHSSVREVFAAYDDDKDCYLTLNNFLKVYSDLCKKNENLVWTELQAHKKDSRLRKQKYNKKQNETSTAYNLVSLISSDHAYIELLFSFLELEDEIASEAFELMNRLPAHPRIFSDIALLNRVKNITSSQKPDWSQIFDQNHNFKLFYCLTIVDYLTSHRKGWLKKFCARGGYEYLDSC